MKSLASSLAVAVLLVSAAGTAPTRAATEPAAAGQAAQAEPLTVAQAMTLLAALRNLDGHQVVVKNGEQTSIVMQPWEFKSGALRMAVAADLAILAAIEAAQERVRQGLVRDVFKGAVPKDNTDEMSEFTRQWIEATSRPAAGADRLQRIKASDLRLDVNEIGVTTLQALAPILDR